MTTAARIRLRWLPVGSGNVLSTRASATWEWIRARRRRRAARPLLHSALEVFDGATWHVIEMAPVWGGPGGPRGVVAVGPVGARPLGRLRAFRYEVRCWAGGTIPDLAWAVGPPVDFTLTASDARALVARVADVPRLTWGRDVFGIGDMWNSNSLVAWLLCTSGIDAAGITPPGHGLAPGWDSGITAAGG